MFSVGGPRVVYPGQLWHGVRRANLVPGALCCVRGELCHAAPLQELLVLNDPRSGLQLPGRDGSIVARAHHAD